MVCRDESLPARVAVYEVGPRDGLQAEPRVLPTAEKIRFIRALERAGLREIEATSFVSARWVPQLSDATEVLKALDTSVARMPVLVPNERGLERAVAAGARRVAVFVSATETFAQRNLNHSRREAMQAAVRVTRSAIAAGLTVRGYVSMCFGDPWEGVVDPSTVVETTRELQDAGCDEISLGDTIGVATAGQVKRVVGEHFAAGVPRERLALHLHDTYGQALANVLAGLQMGITTFDSSAGGIGGCPFAGSATGNLATENLLWMLDGLGIETGVDLAAVAAAGRSMAATLGRPYSAVGGALAG